MPKFFAWVLMNRPREPEHAPRPLPFRACQPDTARARVRVRVQKLAVCLHSTALSGAARRDEVCAHGRSMRRTCKAEDALRVVVAARAPLSGGTVVLHVARRSAPRRERAPLCARDLWGGEGNFGIASRSGCRDEPLWRSQRTERRAVVHWRTKVVIFVSLFSVSCMGASCKD